MSTLLTIDVGNTNSVFGLFDGDELVEHWRLSTSARRTPDEWWLMISALMQRGGRNLAEVDEAVIASVVPKATVALARMFERAGVGSSVVSWQTDSGLRIDLPEPSELGADRLANAVAAQSVFPGESVIVVDMGTATTLDVVTSEAYVGGVILPGLDISMEALFDRAAALRRVNITPPDRVIGNSTATAVRSGATHGFVSQIDGLCALVEREVGPCRVLATGGLAVSISSLSGRIETYDPWLTLRGLRIIWERSTS